MEAPWFQDERRYGTRTIVARKWTCQGYRPESPMKYGYKYGYLFQAVQPSTGKTFELYLPNMSGDCLKLFMTEFDKQYPNQTMIMDNAGCHHVNWQDDDFPFPNVKIEYLSAYSPDFNPQERVFQEIKKVMNGKIYDDLEAIENDIDDKLKQFWKNPSLIQQLTQWK